MLIISLTHCWMWLCWVNTISRVNIAETICDFQCGKRTTPENKTNKLTLFCRSNIFSLKFHHIMAAYCRAKKPPEEVYVTVNRESLRWICGIPTSTENKAFINICKTSKAKSRTHKSNKTNEVLQQHMLN